MSVRTLPPKDDPPLVVDPDAVEPLQIALEWLETVTVQPCMADPSLTPIGGSDDRVVVGALECFQELSALGQEGELRRFFYQFLPEGRVAEEN